MLNKDLTVALFVSSSRNPHIFKKKMPFKDTKKIKYFKPLGLHVGFYNNENVFDIENISTLDSLQE
jgi:hypothetical protein